MTCIIFSRPY